MQVRNREQNPKLERKLEWYLRLVGEYYVFTATLFII
jgi:hypothetical protein